MTIEDDFLSSVYISRYSKGKKRFSDVEKEVQEKIGELPLPEDDYWRNYLMKRNYYDISKEEAESILNVRIQFLQDYYQRLFSNKLTEKEQSQKKPKNYKGPYLPTMQELKRISNMVIHIDWNVPEHQKAETNQKLNGFNRVHREKLLKRWMHFQKEYEIYDLRPLLGERCGVVKDSIDEDKIEFIFYRFLKQYQYMEFLAYMAKDTPDLNLGQVAAGLRSICDLYEDRKLPPNFQDRMFLNGFEYHLLYLIYDKFGDEYGIEKYLALLIGKRTSHKYSRITVVSGRYRNIPFEGACWSRADNLELLKLVRSHSRAKSLKEIMTMKERLPWTEIFYKFKSRRYMLVRQKFSKLRQRVLDALSVRENKDVKLQWKEEQTIKLIELIYNTDNAKSTRDINWYKIAEHFPGYSASYVQSVFKGLVKGRVPAKKRKYFEEVMEYLYHKIKPIYKLHDVQKKDRKKEVQALLGLKESEDITEDIAKILDDGVILKTGSETTTQDPSQMIPDHSKKNPEDHATCNKLAVQSMEEDEAIWQDIMKEHNFEWTYPESLQKKLKCMYMEESESEDEDLQLASQSSSGNRTLAGDYVRRGSRSTVKFGRRKNLSSSTNSEVLQEISIISSEDELDTSSDFSIIVPEQNYTLKNHKRQGLSEIEKKNRYHDISSDEDSELIDGLLLDYESEFEDFDVEIVEPESVRKRHKKKTKESQTSSNAVDLFPEPNVAFSKSKNYQRKLDNMNPQYCEDETEKRERKKHKKKLKDLQTFTDNIEVELEQDNVILESTSSHKTNTTVPKLNRLKREDLDAASLVVEDLPEETSKKKKKKKHNRDMEESVESYPEHSNVATEFLLNSSVENLDSPQQKKRKKHKRSHEHEIICDNKPRNSDIELSESITKINKKSKRRNKHDERCMYEDELNFVTVANSLHTPVLEAQEHVMLKPKKRKRDYDDNPNDTKTICEGKDNNFVRDYTESQSINTKVKKPKKRRNAEIGNCDRIFDIMIDDSTKEKSKKKKDKHKRNNENKKDNNILEIVIDDPTEERDERKKKKRKRQRDCEDYQPDDIGTHGEDVAKNISVSQKSEHDASDEIVDLTTDESPLFKRHKKKRKLDNNEHDISDKNITADESSSKIEKHKKKKKKRDKTDLTNINPQGENKATKYTEHISEQKRHRHHNINNEILDITADDDSKTESHKNKKKHERQCEDQNQPCDVITNNDSNLLNDKAVKMKVQLDEHILTKKVKKSKRKELLIIQDEESQNHQYSFAQDLDQTVLQFSKKSKKHKTRQA